MESASFGRPLRGALAALVASNHSDKDLCELLIRLGDGRADSAAQTMEWGEYDYFWEAAASKEDGFVLVAPTSVSPVAIIRPDSFVA